MKIFLFFIFISSFAHADKSVVSEMYIDFLPLEIQLRYEDSADQTRSNRQYQAYDLGYQFSDFRAQLQWSQFYDTTGNNSLKINQTIRELNLGLGYRIYHISNTENKLDLSSFLVVWGGQTQTEVETVLLSNQNSIQSDKDMLLGAGINLVGRLSYLVIETDLKILNSKNMSPKEIPVFGFKIGAGIPLNF